MEGRFDWWRTDLADEGPTRAVALDLVAADALEAGATGAGAQGAAQDLIPGLVPVATRDAIIPAPGLEGSLAPSQETASLVLATAGLDLDLTNPNLVHALANLGPVQPSGNPSPAPKAVLR